MKYTNCLHFQNPFIANSPVRKAHKRFFHLINLYTILFFLLLVFKADCAMFYVDYLNGNDNNNGIYTSNPFKHVPGDVNATSNAANTVLAPGDTVIFRGGIQYKGKIDVKWSGNKDNVITYDGNSAGTWGSGRAIIDGNNYSLVQGFDINNKSYVNICNFVITKQQKRGILISDGCSYITVSNLNIYDISDWKLENCLSCDDPYVKELGAGIVITGVSMGNSNILIDNVHITKVGHVGIAINSFGDSIDVRNCSFHDYIHWQLDINVDKGKVLSNVNIHHNKLYNLFHYSSQYWTGEIADEKVHYGSGENPHQDGIFVRNPLIGTLSNIRIFANEFYNEADFTDEGGTAMLFVSEPRVNDSIYIYNNTFQDCYPWEPLCLLFLLGGEIHVYNNTFYQETRNALRVHAEDNSTTKVYIKNNLFHIKNKNAAGTPLRLNDPNTATRVVSDYNIFKLGGPGCYIVSGPDYYSTLEEWQNSKFHQDQHSLSVLETSLVNPLGGVLSGSSNLRINFNSPAINVVSNFSEIFTTDKDGRLRPEIKNWTAGAYEPKILAAPNNFRIVNIK